MLHSDGIKKNPVERTPTFAYLKGISVWAGPVERALTFVHLKYISVWTGYHGLNLLLNYRWRGSVFLLWVVRNAKRHNCLCLFF